MKKIIELFILIVLMGIISGQLRADCVSHSYPQPLPLRPLAPAPALALAPVAEF